MYRMSRILPAAAVVFGCGDAEPAGTEPVSVPVYAVARARRSSG